LSLQHTGTVSSACVIGRYQCRLSTLKQFRPCATQEHACLVLGGGHHHHTSTRPVSSGSTLQSSQGLSLWKVKGITLSQLPDRNHSPKSKSGINTSCPRKRVKKEPNDEENIILLQSTLWVFIFKVTEPNSIPYGTHSACAKWRRTLSLLLIVYF
jgi:hypothetical protein